MASCIKADQIGYSTSCHGVQGVIPFIDLDNGNCFFVTVNFTIFWPRLNLKISIHSILQDKAECSQILCHEGKACSLVSLVSVFS